MQIEITNSKSANNKNFEDEVAKVIELTRFNKINAKNAFDINVGFIESITNMLVSKDEESAWQKASASLDATAKIYGYRVDSVHTETFKFLGGLNRNKKDINIKEDNENKNDDESSKEEVVEEIKKKEKVRKGVNTLETNIKKLNLSKYDIDSDIDPLFSLMTSKFNDSTAKGLLLNTIPLDEKINYILESKKVDDKPKPKIDTKKSKPKEEEDIDTKKKEEEDEIKSLKDDSSEASETKKIKDALNLANNLQKKDDSDSDDESSRSIPVACAQDFDQVRESIKKVLKSFIKDNTIDDFIHLQICPELNVFRESRKLINEETNLSFINTFKEEINQADKKLAQDFDENASMMDEEEQENLAEGEEALAKEEDNLDADYKEGEENENQQKGEGPSPSNSNFNPKGAQNNLTEFKYEDLIERAGHFGSGNTQNLPQFMNFAKNFGKLEKNSFFTKGSMLGLKKEGGVKRKKEEKNFAFDDSNEVNINDLFTDMNPKILGKINDNSNDYEKRRKVKCFINFDKLSQFKLFTITGKTITSKDIDNDLDINQQEKNLEISKNADKGEEKDENDKENEIIGFEKNNEYDSFYQNEKKAEKNFGKLYRKFDIRALKKKIWNSYEEIKDKQIDFKTVVVNMSKNMTEEEIFSISTPTCFVCMLHLCNEKNLFIQQKDMNTFYIERDPDGAKSANAIGRRNRGGDDSSSDSD
jgi:hypothetical protein